MAMVSMVVGATTDTSAVFVVKVDTGPAAVAYSTSSDMSNPTTSSSVAVDAQGVAKVEVTGLTAGTRYYWRTVDNGTTDTGTTGQFRTHPTSAGTAASYIYGVGCCAGHNTNEDVDGSPLAADRISNSAIFSTIRTKALAEEWLGFIHLGDLHYYDLGSDDHGIVGGGSLTNYRTAFDDVLTQTNQAALYRSVPWTYIYHDHDWGPNNSDGTIDDHDNALQVYRERVPHYDLDDVGATPVYQAWQVGRVQHVLFDCNADRENTVTILGSNQLTWLENLLDTSTAEAMVWWMPEQWLADSGNTFSWAAYSTEQETVTDLVEEYGWTDKIVMAAGDRHALGVDTGGNSAGGIPLLSVGSLDSTPDDQYLTLFDQGPNRPGRHQYGTVRVDDNGDEIAITLTGWRRNRPWRWHTHYIGSATGLPAGSPSHVLAL